MHNRRFHRCIGSALAADLSTVPSDKRASSSYKAICYGRYFYLSSPDELRCFTQVCVGGKSSFLLRFRLTDGTVVLAFVLLLSGRVYKESGIYKFSFESLCIMYKQDLKTTIPCFLYNKQTIGISD